MGRDNVMREALERFVSGSSTFEEMVTRTLPVWRRLAKTILRKWRAPTWMVVEDVVQEMLSVVTEWAFKFQTGRGPSIDEFVIYNCMAEGKYQVHIARGVSVHGNPDRERSCFETPFSAFASDGADDREAGDSVERICARAGSVADPDHVHRLDALDAFDAAAATVDNVSGLVVIRAIAEEGSIVGAASAIWEDRNRRRICRLKAPAEAARLVDATVYEVAGKLGVIEAA